MSYPSRKSYYSFLSKLILLLASIIICFAAAEVFLRIIYPNTNIYKLLLLKSQRTLQLDSSLIYSRVPSIYSEWKTDEFTEKAKANKLGWRDREVEKKDDNTYRVIAVGDSFTFGHGISTNEKTYPKQLEKYLISKNKSPHKIEVFNAGEKGYSPDQEYRLIIERVIPQKPDLVIWNLTNPGDLYNLTHSSTSTPTWPIPALYGFEDNKLVPLDARWNWLYITNFIRRNTPKVIGESYLLNFTAKIASQNHIFSRKPILPQKEFLRWALKKLIREIEDIQKRGKENNFGLLVVILPYKVVFTSNTDYIHGFDKLEKRLTEKGISVLDIKKEMEKSNFYIAEVQKLSFDDLYFKQDYHPNEFGTQVFAEIVSQTVIKIINIKNGLFNPPSRNSTKSDLVGCRDIFFASARFSLRRSA